ncbi:MAG: efflux RND transporter periplasmic adaptor subunit [Halioglobus sp.]
MSLRVFKILLPMFTVATLLLVIAWVAGLFSEKVQPGLTQPIAEAVAEVILVSTSQAQLYESVAASIEAKQATIISSRILARIEKVFVRAGDEVEKGQTLIELEKSDLESRVARAEASIQAVSARLIEAQQSLARSRELAGQGVLAQGDLDRAQANHDSLLADLASARQTLNEATAALGFARVVAPIAGRIVDRFAEPGDTAQPGMQLLSLYNPLSLRVEAHVREALALTLKPDQPLRVTIAATGETIDSVIEEMVPAGNAGSRSFLVKSRLQHSTGLLPGMYAHVHIPAGEISLILIPKSSVASVGQLDVVRVQNGTTVERRFVQIGKAYPGEMVEVIAGIEGGDSVLLQARTDN